MQRAGASQLMRGAQYDRSNLYEDFTGLEAQTKPLAQRRISSNLRCHSEETRCNTPTAKLL
jgi:hypothetical protein